MLNSYWAFCPQHNFDQFVDTGWHFDILAFISLCSSLSLQQRVQRIKLSSNIYTVRGSEGKSEHCERY
jgi:hypothetical protein